MAWKVVIYFVCELSVVTGRTSRVAKDNNVSSGCIELIVCCKLRTVRCPRAPMYLQDHWVGSSRIKFGWYWDALRSH